MNITLAEAAEFVAPHIDRSWPNDRESIFKILDLVQEEIWLSGLFTGSTKWFYTSVRADNTIITPHGYNKLLGAKIGCSPAIIKDVYWTFHTNGPMSEPECSNEYSNIVQHIGDYPTLINHYADAKFKCNLPRFRVAVSSECSPNFTDPPVTVISGLGCDGKPVYSYGKSQNYKLATEEDITNMNELRNYGDDIYVESDILEGLQFPITNRFIKKDTLFSEIYNISKDPTLARVEYYAIPEDDDGTGILLASLEPFQTHSSYSIYKIKQECVTKDCCYALFKRSKPDKCVSDNQFFITSSKTALLDFAKGMHSTYYKDNPQVGNVFIANGMRKLSLQVQNENPTKDQTIQVRSPIDEARKVRRFR